MLYPSDKSQLRQYFCDVWQRYRDGTPLQATEQLIADIIVEHPEYHSLLANPQLAIQQTFASELGQSNPFLHLSIHIAVREQLQTQRPIGITQLYQQLLKSIGNSHDTEHRIMECLAEILWESQHNGRLPDDASYLEKIQQMIYHQNKSHKKSLHSDV